MIKTLRSKKGVTLVELLAVIVIMGIIAAIAVPAIGRLISSQQQRADVASANSVLSAARIFATEQGASGEVTAAELTPGYISSNPFGATVTFEYDNAGNIEGITEDGPFQIQGRTWVQLNTAGDAFEPAEAPTP